MIGADSNVLIYASIRSADRRHGSAVDVLNVLMQRRLLFLPLQVVGETFHVLIRKGRVEPVAANAILTSYRSFAIVEPYHEVDVLAAIDAVARYRLSFWDAVIWAVCERCGVTTLFTEDMQDGRTLGHVTFVNPFGEQAAALLRR